VSGRDPIKVYEDAANPPFARWVATFGDYDLGDPVRNGATPQEAIEDLKMWAGEDE
jgi:hypothetical protein